MDDASAAVTSGQQHGEPDDSKGTGRPVLTMVLIAVLALVIGTILLTLLQELIHLIWVAGIPSLPDPAMWVVVVATTTVAGLLVALVRRRDDGHNPLGGIAMLPVRWAQYPAVLGAVVISLLGGLVLGPEVALVVTGSLIGCEVAARRGDMPQQKAMTLGILAAVMALFVRPLLGQDHTVTPSYEFAAQDLVGAIVVAIATSAALVLGRFAAVGLLSIRGGDVPKPLPMALVGLVIGVGAMTYHTVTGEGINLVLTSGEEQITSLVGLGTAGAIGAAVAVKWLLYALSMGGGFRGGPFFPALFVGAGLGAIATDLAPGYAEGAAAAGLTAAFSYLLHGSWKSTIILGAILGMFVGGWQAVLLCVVAAFIGKALPLLKVFTKPTGELDIKIVA